MLSASYWVVPSAPPRLATAALGALGARLHPYLRGGRRTMPTYRAAIYAGVGVGTAVSLSLTLGRGLRPAAALAAVTAALAAALTLGVLSRLRTGDERLVGYQYQLLAAAVVAATLYALGEPVLAYLDVLSLGLGAVVSVCRLGCLSAGCCHGRPSKWGITYRAEHAADGFPAYLVGVPLVPVQLLESAWVAVVTAAGALILFSDPRPGSALAAYAVLYAMGRFGLEFLRGDPERRYRAGLSDAQWTSLRIVGGVCLAEAVGLLPPSQWHWVAAAILTVGTLTALLAPGESRVLAALHLAQLAVALHRAGTGTPDAVPRIAVTSEGLGISFTPGGRGCPRWLAFSSAKSALSERTVRRLGRLLVLLAHGDEALLVRGSPGTFHLDFRADPSDSGRVHAL